jgi:hypothetical protein
MGQEKILEAKNQVGILRQLASQLDMQSQKVLDTHTDHDTNIGPYLRAKNAFQDNAAMMIEVAEKEIDGLIRLQTVLVGSDPSLADFGGKLDMNGEQQLLIPITKTEADEMKAGDKDVTKFLQTAPALPIQTIEDLPKIARRTTLIEREYIDEFKRVRNSIIDINRPPIDHAKLSRAILADDTVDLVIPLRQTSIITPQRLHPFIQTLIDNNEAFKLYPVTETAVSRARLPALRDPNVKINIWAILKENIGKDLSKMQIPVYVKEPITLTQKMAEFIEFLPILREANCEPDPAIRTARVASFFVMEIAQNKYRLKASFNSLLGETFEWIEGDLRCVIEAVSVHPPIQAFYCESKDFRLSGCFQLKTNLSIASMEFETLGNFDIFLKLPAENYLVKRPKMTLHNYILGDMYIWVKGDLVITNQNTGERALVTFRSKGWSSKHDYEIGGEVKAADGSVRYQVVGRWDQFMAINDPATNQQTVLSQKGPEMTDSALQFNFSQFVVNLNHLPANLSYRLPPTDARFRPDTRAYENGNLELAAIEKNRLEELQRERRKSHTGQKPLWFSFELKGKEAKTQFLGTYFDCRDKRRWPQGFPNLFNDPL